MVGEVLDVGTVDLDVAAGALVDVLLAPQVGEAPVLGDDDLLAAGELVLGAAEGLDGVGQVGVTGSDGEQDLADLDTGNETVGLAVGTTHTGLETIGSGARQLGSLVTVAADGRAELTILLMRMTWYGWARTRMWKPSLPHVLTMYLLAAMRAASRASELNCSSSLETMCTQAGKSSTPARFLPRSKMRIFASGTPRLNLLLG